MSETPAAGRGRPRPDATVTRDKQVLEYLAGHEGGRTRKEIVTDLSLGGSEAYLSLYRLSRTEPPAIVKNGSRWAVAPAAGTSAQ